MRANVRVRVLNTVPLLAGKEGYFNILSVGTKPEIRISVFTPEPFSQETTEYSIVSRDDVQEIDE